MGVNHGKVSYHLEPIAAAIASDAHLEVKVLITKMADKRFFPLESSFLVLLHACLFTVTHAMLLETECNKATDPELCLNVFGSDPATRAASSLVGLAQIGIARATSHAEQTRAGINTRLFFSTESKERNVLSQCVHKYNGALATLNVAPFTLRRKLYSEQTTLEIDSLHEGCVPRGKEYSLLMANCRNSQTLISSSSESDDYDSDSSKSDDADLSGGSGFFSDSKTRSVGSRGFPKGSTPLENPLLGDDPEWSDPLGVDDKDALSGQDVGSLREVLGIPPECDIKVPGPQDDCHTPPLGYFTLFLEYFTGGLVFPLQPLLVELVKSLGMSFSQLTPNAVIVYSAFCHKMKEIHMPLSVELFHSLFSACRSKPDSHVYFQPRAKCKFLSRIPSPKSSWKSHFFYVKDCGWGIPVVWSSGLRVIAMRETHHALQLQCRNLGLFEKLCNPRNLMTAGDRFDLATIRARKATVGRRSPLAGEGRAPANRAVHDFRDPICKGIPPARSEHVRGSGSNSQKKTNYSPSSKTLEIRPANGGGGEAKKKQAHEGVQKKIDEEAQKNPKRIRADDQGASSKTSRFKHIFVDGVNHSKKADSFWDFDDPEIGWKKGRSIVGDYDMVHLVSLSTDSFAHSFAWNSCQGLSLASAVRVREERLRNCQDKMHEEVARLKEENFRLTQEKEKINVELLQVQEKLADKLKDFTILEERYSTEVKTGGQFLDSEVGNNLLKRTEEKGAQNFKAFSAFREEVLDRAMIIHDEVVLDCRNQLRKKLVPEEIVMMIEPSVPEVGGGSMVDVPSDNAGMIEALDLRPTEGEA
ncbi:uncharacterized protein [Primulina huaijiensis]|uniref:uncharacterized protein isoform X1 n=1 Tax=Primulina huaijiensis TaxID=1492673 RepID=UPI003CC79960